MNSPRTDRPINAGDHCKVQWTRRFIFCGFAALFVAGAAWVAASAQDFSAGEFRRWTTAGGVQSSVNLRAVAIVDGKVRLEREDGRFVELKLSALSEADRRYLRSLKNADGNDEATTPVATSNTAGDWPRWRGANNDGISTETGLMQSWPANGPDVLWSTDGLGGGYSSVAIWDDKIYTLGRKGGQTQMICLSTDGGKSLWETPMGGGDAPNCTPTVDPEGKLVYGLTHAGVLVCCDAVSGDEKWRVDFGAKLRGRMMSGWGYSESPLVDGNRLICTPGGDSGVMAALDKNTGEVIWKTPMDGSGGAGYASPVISYAGGIKQYVTLVGRGLIGVAAENGRLLWHYQRIANGTANVPTPIVYDDLVFGSSGYGDGGSALLRLHKQGNGIRVEELYYLKNNQLQNHHGGMVRVDNLIYMGHGHNKGFPVCFDLQQGQPKWGPQRGPGSGSAALTVADGKLYFRYENGVMALIDASPSGYKVAGQFKIKSNNGKSWAHPVIADKKLYLRDQQELHCYDIARD